MKLFITMLMIFLFWGATGYAQAVDMIDETISEDDEVYAETISMENITITNYAKLYLGSKGGVRINAPFVISMGAQLRIAVEGHRPMDDDPYVVIPQWILYKLNGEEVPIDPPILLTFNIEGRLAQGQCFCNRYKAPYYFVGTNRLVFSRILGTKAYCGQELFVTLEDEYRAMLESIDHYEVIDDQLLLYHGNQLLLEFYQYY